MESLNLYYNSRLLELNGKKEFLAIPVREVEIDFYLDRNKLNLYQEIVLGLFKCGHGNIQSIEEVLKLTNIESEDVQTSTSLSKYVVEELRNLGYIKGDEITDEGKDILKENFNDEKELGSIFYNEISKEYMNFLKVDRLYDLAKTGQPFKREKITLKNDEKKVIPLGDHGKTKKVSVSFLKTPKVERKELDFDSFSKILDSELWMISKELKNHLDEEQNSLSKSESNEFYTEKKNLLYEIRKYKEKSDKKSYVLVALVNGRLKNSFNPDFIDYSLESDLKSYENIKEIFKEQVDEEFGTSIEENEEIQAKLGDKEMEIVRESNDRLSMLPELVKRLANLTTEEKKQEEMSRSQKDDEYGKNINLIYECFGEVLLFLFERYQRKEKIKLSKKINNKLNAEVILGESFSLSKELVDYYTWNLDNKGIPHIKDNKKLKDLLVYTLILEQESKENTLEDYIRESNGFFSLIKRLVDERNKFSHSSEGQGYTDEELEYDFESEIKNGLIEFIEKVFGFKFKDSLKIETISDELAKKTREKSRLEINSEFEGYDKTEILNELIDTKLNHNYYENFRIPAYKALFIKKVGVLLEKNLKVLKEILDKRLILDRNLKKGEKIYLKDVDRIIFENKETKNTWIDTEFNKIKGIYLNVDSILKTSKHFSKGTLNTYAGALLFSEKNTYLENVIKKCPEFFKLVFIVSSLRGHNGDFKLSENGSEKDELLAVEKFLDVVYDIQKKILRIKENI